MCSSLSHDPIQSAVERVRNAFDARTTKLRALVHAVANHASYNGEECSICLTTLTTDSAVLPKCGHMFHRPCLSQHMAVRAGAVCPVCRRALSPRALVRVRSGIPNQDSLTAPAVLSAALDKLAMDLDCNREVGVLMAAVDAEQGRIRRMRIEIEEDGRLTRAAREEYRSKRDEASKQMAEYKTKETALEKREREIRRLEEHHQQDFEALNLQLSRMKNEAIAEKRRYLSLCKAVERKKVEENGSGRKKRGAESEVIDLTEYSPLRERTKRARVGLTDRELEMLTHMPEVMSRKKRRVRDIGTKVELRRSRRRRLLVEDDDDSEEEGRDITGAEVVTDGEAESRNSGDVINLLVEDEGALLQVEAEENDVEGAHPSEEATISDGSEEMTEEGRVSEEDSRNDVEEEETEEDAREMRGERVEEEEGTADTDRLMVRLRLCAPVVRTRLRRPSRLDGESFNAVEAEMRRGGGRATKAVRRRGKGVDVI